MTPVTDPTPAIVCAARGCTATGDHTTLVGYHLCRGHWGLYAKGVYPLLKPGTLDAALADQQPQPSTDPPTQSQSLMTETEE